MDALPRSAINQHHPSGIGPLPMKESKRLQYTAHTFLVQTKTLTRLLQIDVDILLQMPKRVDSLVRLNVNLSEQTLEHGHLKRGHALGSSLIGSASASYRSRSRERRRSSPGTCGSLRLWYFSNRNSKRRPWILSAAATRSGSVVLCRSRRAVSCMGITV